MAGINTTTEISNKSGLTPEELKRIETILGRTPNNTELYIYSVILSKISSYKDSSNLLNNFDTKKGKSTKEASKSNVNFNDLSLEIISEPKDLRKIANDLFKKSTLTTKKWVTNQHLTKVNTGSIYINNPSDASLIKVKDSDKTLVASLNYNSRYFSNDAENGIAIIIAEAARNIICSGGAPKALALGIDTNNPEFSDAISGINRVCEKLDIPVIVDNIDFSDPNSENISSVLPTSTISMLGEMDSISNKMTMDFKYKGDMIYLIGKSENDISCSEYLSSYHKIEQSPAPKFDLDTEIKIQSTVKSLISKQYISSAHDISDGGLYVSLIESAIHNKLGFDITSDAEINPDAFLFGEAQSRIIVSVNEDQEDDFIDYMVELNIPFSALGHVTKGELRVDDYSYGFIANAKKAYENLLGE
jgi:phosphoribosylformylglycinamidine synthase